MAAPAFFVYASRGTSCHRSALLRQALARKRTWTALALAVERECSRQVTPIGSNVNQLGRWANSNASTTKRSPVQIASRRFASVDLSLAGRQRSPSYL